MDRWVSARRRVRGDAEVLREMLARRLPELLAQATGSEPARPDGDGSFPLTLVSEAGHIPLMKRVRCELEPVRTSGSWTRIGMSWFAESAKPLFPVFQGAIEFEPLDSTSCEVAVIGHYDPPLGPLGAFADALSLHASAQVTVDWIATGLADAMAAALQGIEVSPPREAHRLLVRQVMAVRPLLLREDDDLREAARKLLAAGIEGAPVEDAGGNVVGVLSLKDLLEKVVPPPSGFGRRSKEARRHHAALTVGEACTRPARTTEADASLRDAAGVMVDERIGRLVVLDGARVVGMIDRADAVTSLIRSDTAITRAVEDALGDIDQDLVAEVRDGVVSLVGAVATRGLHDSILAVVRDLDGVLAVEADRFLWDVDDLTPTLGV